MPRRKSRPTYRLHRPSGRAYCWLNGKMVYLGPWESPESKRRFADLVHDWCTSQDLRDVILAVDDLVLRFLNFADGYYRHPDGSPTGAVKASATRWAGLSGRTARPSCGTSGR